MKFECLPVVATLILTFSSAPARAEQPPVLPQAQVVSDDTLSQIRGMYVPPQSRTAALPAGVVRDAAAGTTLTFAQSASPAQRGSLNPLSSISAREGTVTYFGVEMVSTWTQAGANGAQGVSAGLDLDFDLATGRVSIAKWSSSTNGGLSNAQASGSISGSVNDNFSSGIDQNIQAAGNGNIIANTAVVTVGSVGAAVAFPATNTCGSQCAITIGPGGAAVSIQTPQGNVLQAIGPNGILQSAQVLSNMNTIDNQLGVHVQMSAAPTFNAGSVLPILQTLTGLP
jgi:hypothetical protein